MQECLRRAEEILFEGGRVLIDASFQNESRRRLFLDAGRRWGILSVPDPVSGRSRNVVRRAAERSDGATRPTPTGRFIARSRERWEELSSRNAGGDSPGRYGRTRKTRRCGVRSSVLREFGLVGGRLRGLTVTLHDQHWQRLERLRPGSLAWGTASQRSRTVA